MAHENLFMLQPGGPKAGTATPGTTSQDAPPAGGAPAASSSQAAAPNMWIMLAPLLVVMVVMLFTNKNQRKREAETRAKLKKGDRVVSQSGLIGELIDMDDRTAKVKIAPGTNVQMLITSISPYDALAGSSAAKVDDKSLKDLKDAKATADKKG